MENNRQIIYIEIDEDVTSVFDRIKKVRRKEIMLVIPRKALLFQSGVNLKILNNKLTEKGKSLTIVTSDRNGKHIAEKLNISVVSRVEVEKTHVNEEESPQMRIQPIQARRNVTLKEEQPQRFTEKKISIRELLQEFRMQDKKKKKGSGDAFSDFHYMKPKRKFLALIIIISLGLFSLISYIALPTATIYIKPKFDNLDFSVNVVLADKRKNQTLLQQNQAHVLASEEISTTTKQTKIFKTASKEFNGRNATGKIKIVNTNADEWDLREGTRFQSEDEGVIFRTLTGVTVPARSTDESGNIVPGSIVVKVEADPFDVYGDPVGDRGNVLPSRFTIPGLSKYNQRIIWGESEEPFSGGVTAYRNIVREDDIESAKKQIEDNLIMMAKEDLRTYIDEVNKVNKTELTLLDDSRYLTTELEDIRYSEGLEDSYRDKFELFAKINAQGVAFDYSQLFALLKKELGSRTHPNMHLREDSISPKNVSYEVVDQDDVLGQIKITATVVGIEEFQIDEATEAGSRFAAKVKDKVRGLTIQEAEGLIGNLPEVDAVEIKTWPIWISKIPRIPESIEMKLME